MKYLKNKNYKGQSMFEMVLAIFIITMIIVAVVVLSTNSISNSLFSRNKTTANRYSQEAIEWLRSERDLDFENFKTNAIGTYCLQNPLSSSTWSNTGACSSSEVIDTNSIFKRDVVFTTTAISASQNAVQAVVTTRWDDSRGTHEAIITTNFTDIRER